MSSALLSGATGAPQFEAVEKTGENGVVKMWRFAGDEVVRLAQFLYPMGDDQPRMTVTHSHSGHAPHELSGHRVRSILFDQRATYIFFEDGPLAERMQLTAIVRGDVAMVEAPVIAHVDVAQGEFPMRDYHAFCRRAAQPLAKNGARPLNPSA